MIRKFINWKKNIKPISWNGLNVYFDLETVHFATYWERLCEIILSDNNFILYDEFLTLSKSKTTNTELKIRQKKFNPKKSPLSGQDTYVSFKHLKVRRRKLEQLLFMINVKNISPNIISQVMAINGVRLAYFYNPYFRLWENRKSPDSYYYSGGLKKYYNPLIGEKEIDISERPGRYTVCDKFTFNGGSEYWIHKSLVKESELLNLPFDIQLNENNDVYHIKLFELNEYWNDDAQEKINLIRKTLDVDK
jgi:hypothetical protein